MGLRAVSIVGLRAVSIVGLRPVSIVGLRPGDGRVLAELEDGPVARA